MSTLIFDFVPEGTPVLRYKAVRTSWGYEAVTEPCPYCGKRHHHGADQTGNGDGHRVAHCGRHTHDVTMTGRRRSIYAKGVRICSGCENRGYVLVSERTKP